MSYHQIIVTSRQERPINDDVIHDIIWNAFDQGRASSGGYPTVRVLDVKGNVIDEANRRLADTGARRQYPSQRETQPTWNSEEPELDDPDEPTSRGQMCDVLMERGYPVDDLFTFRLDEVAVTNDSNPQLATRVPNHQMVLLPPYSSLPMHSDYDQHELDCDCNECFAPETLTALAPMMKVLLSCATHRDGWDLNVDNVNRDWFDRIADIHNDITGARP